MRNRHKKYTIVWVLMCLLNCGCTDRVSESVLGFHTTVRPEVLTTCINPDLLGRPEAISVSDSMLVLLDFFDGQLYSSFDLNTGKRIMRFGTIGEGPKEFPIGTSGHFFDGRFTMFSRYPSKIGDMDPALGDTTYSYFGVAIPDKMMVSRIHRLSDSLLIAMGSYNEAYKYILFDVNHGVVDSICDISGKDRNDLNRYHKFLAEQGNIAVSPDLKRIVSTTNYSDNIDFLNFKDGKLRICKLNHERDAHLKPEMFGTEAFQMIPDRNEPMGFLNVCANNENVFALYNPCEFAVTDYSSPYILVYDWSGNKIIAIDTQRNVIDLAANSHDLYLLTINDEGDYAIERINLKNLDLQ